MTTKITAPIYSTAGKEVGTIELPSNVFALPQNDALLHQVIVGLQANARTPVAHTKNRGDVRGGGKKPWKQKGTGRARHGSIRSPLWRGGGTTFGPRKERTYAQKINKKMRAKALAIALSAKLKDGRIIFVDSLGLSAPKTSAARLALTGLSKVSGFAELATRRKNAAVVLLPKSDTVALKSFQNMGNISVVETRNTTPLDVLSYRYVLVVDPEVSIKVLTQRISKSETRS